MELRGETIKGRTVDSINLNEPLHMIDCTISGGAIGMLARRPKDRLIVKNVTATNCTIDGAMVGPIVFENVLAEDLKTRQHLWLPACAFIHCTFKGACGELLQFDTADPMAPVSSSENQQFIEDNNRIYSEVDWALDISDAEFEDFELRGVPGELVRINDNSQVCVSFERTLLAMQDGAFENIPRFSKSVLEMELKHRSATKYNIVLTTNANDDDYGEMMTLFKWLRDQGLCH